MLLEVLFNLAIKPVFAIDFKGFFVEDLLIVFLQLSRAVYRVYTSYKKRINARS